MKSYLEKLPREIRHLISVAAEVAHSNNTPAYLVGGFVRDLFLGVRNLDLDIVAEGDGIGFAQVLAQKLNAGLIQHKRFGTATVIVAKHLKVDIATARREYYPQPAHLPEVTRGSLKDDLVRRDFTINAMAISINRGDFGAFIDSFGGRKDLADKKIRVLHNLSFIDDPTRTLRAIRFEQRYNFRIEPNTLKLLAQARKSKMLEKVQPHRIRDELILILKEKHPLKPLIRIRELAGFNFINPGLPLSEKTLAFLKSIGKQIAWFEARYPKRRKLDTWLMYFMGLIEPIGINSVKSICRRFAFHRGEKLRIMIYKKLKPEFIKELTRGKIRPSKVYKLLEPLSYEVIILIKAKFKNKSLEKHIDDFFRIYNGTRIYVSGKDLNGLGMIPGPDYQKILHYVLNAKLDGLVETKKEELELLERIARRFK